MHYVGKGDALKAHQGAAKLAQPRHRSATANPVRSHKVLVDGVLRVCRAEHRLPCGLGGARPTLSDFVDLSKWSRPLPGPRRKGGAPRVGTVISRFSGYLADGAAQRCALRPVQRQDAGVEFGPGTLNACGEVLIQRGQSRTTIKGCVSRIAACWNGTGLRGAMWLSRGNGALGPGSAVGRRFCRVESAGS